MASYTLHRKAHQIRASLEVDRGDAEEMKKKHEGWAIIFPNGIMPLVSCTLLPKDLKLNCVEFLKRRRDGLIWRELEKEGYRCVRVTIEECGDE